MSDIFAPTDTDPVIPENAYETLVGEDKKYKDNESLAKSKLHSDRHIAILEKELAELREANQKATTLEEVKTQILSQIKPTEVPPSHPDAQPDDQPDAKVTDSDLEAKIAALLVKKEAEAQAGMNRKKVQDTLRDKFGSDAQLVLNQKAQELGVSLDYLAGVANDSPSAFFRLVGVDVSQPTPTPSAPRSTTSVAPANNSRVAYWDNMKKTNPMEYFNKANTALRHKEMMRGDLPLRS